MPMNKEIIWKRDNESIYIKKTTKQTARYLKQEKNKTQILSAHRS